VPSRERRVHAAGQQQDRTVVNASEARRFCRDETDAMHMHTTNRSQRLNCVVSSSARGGDDCGDNWGPEGELKNDPSGGGHGSFTASSELRPGYNLRQYSSLRRGATVCRRGKGDIGWPVAFLFWLRDGWIW
jgi:hypothetical protein